MRLFEHFPQDDKTRCPICGTADDKPCFLLPIDGTTRDWVCEAAPTHADCISERLDKLQYNRDVGIVYMRIANADLERAEWSDDTLQDIVGNSAEDAARAKWNAEADEYNQWDSLGQDEKDELIANMQLSKNNDSQQRKG